MDNRTSAEDEGSIRLPISKLWRMSEAGSSGTATMFDPQYSNIEKRDSSTANSISPTSPSPLFPPSMRAPEKKLTLFALRLAVFEKAATGLGTLGFIWATVVLLGGFAITLDKTDFWFITVILLIEGTRIFSRSHELEWQHQATWSLTGRTSFRALRSGSNFILEAAKAIFRPMKKKMSQHKNDDGGGGGRGREFTENDNLDRKPTRTWTSSEVPLLPYGRWVFLSRNISKLLYWLQILSALTCVALSLMKLVKHNYGEVAKGDTDKRNRKSALNIFYALALAEALLFLMEKLYWEYKLSYCKLLQQVAKECELEERSGLVSVRRFFYDSFSRCVNGSVFDGLGMDMIGFAMELLSSNSPDEQLIGVRILRQFVMSDRFSDDTLQKIGTTSSVIERLVEMLNWKDLDEEEIRRSSADVLSKLAGKKQNSLRVAGIPGAMESISSLLQTCRNSGSAADEIGEKRMVFDQANYGFWTFNHLGLLILKKLARDHDNCGKIGNTRGLLPKIIDFTHAGPRMLTDKNALASQILTVKRSLQVVKMLASTTGTTGKQLRKEISEIVFTISNIRDILRHGERHPVLQKLGIEILSNLAIEEYATERIGGTGGVLRELLNIFFNDSIAEKHVRIAAGEALAMLALESKGNCHRILKLGAMEKMMEALESPILRVNAARILRNLCTYSGEGFFHKLMGVSSAAPTVLKAIVTTQESKLQEVMIGLASQVFRFTTTEESSLVFEEAEIRESELARVLIEILKKYRDPPAKVPRIRRFTIELAIWMMRDKAANVLVFKNLGLETQLEDVLDTTSELESFNIFSGTVGLSRHTTTIHSLVETAMKFLQITEEEKTGTEKKFKRKSCK